MDRALLISWYNLKPGDPAAYLAWLHGTYMPKMLARPGVLWGAHYRTEKVPLPARIRYTDEPIPSGDDYILMFGGASSHAFTKDANSYVKQTEDAFSVSLTAADKAMLGLREGERVNIMTEDARVDGPDAGTRQGMGPAPCIQLGSFNGSPPEVEQELLAWYADWRMSALAKLPGCVGMRKMVSVAGWAKHGVMYEFTSLAARNEGMPVVARTYPEMEAWTNRFIPKLVHSARSPHIAQRIWPPVA